MLYMLDAVRRGSQALASWGVVVSFDREDVSVALGVARGRWAASPNSMGYRTT